MTKYAILTLLALNLTACGRVHYEYFQGKDGSNGADAQNCVVSSVAPAIGAPNGGSLISCPGSSSLILNGTNGSNGSNGSNGTNGTPGTVVSSISLCPGVSVYPSKFVEVAFKIGNKLYAVYSANGGFMTEIPPGAYSSNAIGSSCNFTVNADLTISH